MAISQNYPIFAKEVNNLAYITPTPVIPDINTEDAAILWRKKIRKKYGSAPVVFPAQGVAHVRLVRYINKKPVKINVVEINPTINPNLVIKPQIAGDTLNSKAQIGKIANKENALVAINGGFFKPQTGVSLGTLMIDNKMLTGPIYNRVGFGIAQNDEGTKFAVGRIGLNITIQNENMVLKADNINQPRMLSTYTLVYTPDWGQYAPQAPKYGVNAVIKNGAVISISTNSVEIPKQGYVVSGPTDKIARILNENDLALNIKLPQEFENMNHIISGGPYLVKDGKIFIDVTEQKLGAITGKNPRSAIGYTKGGELILVTVDGREETSVGMTLNQLAQFMHGLGCINAMNFDGGGSSVMYVEGKITNSPAQKGGIEISNALTVSENTQVAATSLE
jgi:exopolysaccharide biosynthesis protein